MKLWLDDERDPKKYPGWEDATWVKTPEEAVGFLALDIVTALSLDNDLGLEDIGGRVRDGYAVACWLEDAVCRGSVRAPNVLNVHSANTVASRRIQQCFDSICRMRI